jgi:hypothetical protein
MKYTWTKNDIITGRVVCKSPEYHGFTNKTWVANCGTTKWVYKIGFTNSGGEGNLCLVALTDGMVCSTGKTQEQMAEKLNYDDMIPCPHSRLIAVMDFLRDCYET